ncbi:MAG: TolC family protein, partial [Chlorobiaceae bacterium]|nr:TolC family protein [Chlorobiaceae bacterium]
MRFVVRAGLCLVLLLLLLAGGAESAGLSEHTEKILKQTRAQILGESPETKDDDLLLAVSGQQSSVYPVEKQRMLDAMSGPAAHDPAKARWGESIGKAGSVVIPLSLGEVALNAVKWNLDGQMAKLLPALRETDVMEAKGVFDWEAFSSASYGLVNQPEPASAYNGVPVSGDDTKQRSVEGRMGLRKKVTTGASIEVSTGLLHRDDFSTDKEYVPNPAFISDAVLTVTQPLLRNAGPTVNRFRIAFAENTRERDRFKMEQTLSQVALEAEKAYWELDLAVYRLLVSQELLARTDETLRTLEARRTIDVKPVQMAQAKSFQQSRMEELMRAQTDARNAGDRLKELVNSSRLSLFDESIPVPANRPEVVAEPLTLRSALESAFHKNAELKQAVMELDNAQLEWEANRIQLRPQLDLKLEGRISGMGSKFNSSYDDMGNHLEGKVMLELTVPLENRTARSAFDRSKLTRNDREFNLLKVARSVTRNVKESLRKVQLAYGLTRITREARLAAAENLR